MNPLVSILIPCFNSERWIAQTIESAFAQTWPETEVIVVDDGSTDASLNIIQQFSGRIQWTSGPNQGGNAARNKLLEMANGEWVQYLDADDYLLPNKIAGQMDFISTQPDLDLVFGPVILEQWSEAKAKCEPLPIAEPYDPFLLLARWALPQTGAPLWRRQAIHDVGGWKCNQPCCQEHELYLRLLIAGKRFAYCPATGAVYRQWSNSTQCKRDISEVHRRRLAIEQDLENYLRSAQLLTSDRLRAISQARFETARVAWQYDPNFAREIMRAVNGTDPHFRPHGPAAPAFYRLAFRWLGFRTAELLATLNRKVVASMREHVFASSGTG